MKRPPFAPLKDGGRLAYSVRGKGPALLLVRPVGGSMLSWGAFGDALARRLKVIAFDARGTGTSSEAPRATTTRSLARDAAALLDFVNVSRAHVLGLSLGGMVASWLAVDAPQKVDRLVLAATLPRGLSVKAGAVLRGLRLARCLAMPPAEAEACLVAEILSPAFRAEHPEAVAEVQRVARQHPASRQGLLAMLRAAARHDVRARLHEIAAPTLVIAGQHDPLLTEASQRKLLANIPGATFEVVEGAGHDLSIEAPEQTAERVLAFLGRVQAFCGSSAW